MRCSVHVYNGPETLEITLLYPLYEGSYIIHRRHTVQYPTTPKAQGVIHSANKERPAARKVHRTA
jgi:hypothetical protein